MKQIIFLIIVTLILTSCISEPKHYNWETTLIVTYTNGEKDTIIHQTDLLGSQEPIYKLKTVEENLFIDEKLIPCIVWNATILGNDKNVVCDVKHYVIINQIKNETN